MKCVWLILFMLLLVSVPGFAKSTGICFPKLVSSVDRVNDTSQFTVYLEMLLVKKIFNVRDLEPFLKSLNDNKLTNPIPNRPGIKYETHYQEFEKVMNENHLELREISAWAAKVIAEFETTDSQKEKSKNESFGLPFFISQEGAMFFEFEHPVLGRAFKILKPGGNKQNLQDWENTVWPLEALRGTKNDPFKYYNDPTTELDENESFISEKSPPREACRQVGPGIDLPSYEDYVSLFTHLGRSKNKLTVELSKDGFSKLIMIFPFVKNNHYWTRSPTLIRRNEYVMILNGWAGVLQSTDRSNLAASVICVSNLK